MWDDINDFDALPSCSCSGCECDLNAVYRKRRETNQVREFLMGLETYYANVRSNILGIEPLPSLHTVYSRLVQEEEVWFLTQRRAETATTMAFVVRGNALQGSKTGGATRPPLKCTFCRKSGHLEDCCWEKQGYLDGREPRRPMVGRGRDGSNSLNNAQPAKTNTLLGEVSATTNHVRMNGKDVHTWIVDSGASIHVCCDENLFDSCKTCLLYTSPSPRDGLLSRMPSSA